jgi:hypothetical protein
MIRMKFTCSILLFLMSVSPAFAQDKPTLTELEGKWNVVAMNIPGLLYFNTLTDSAWMSNQELNEIGKGEPIDSSTKNLALGMIKSVMKTQFSKMFFLFDKEGNMFDVSRPGSKTRMAYYDATAGIFHLSEKEGGEEKQFPAEIKAGLLTLHITDKGKAVTIWCNKMDTVN